MIQYRITLVCFFFNDPATTEIYTRSIVGSVRCVQETDTVLSDILTGLDAGRCWREKYIPEISFLGFDHSRYFRGKGVFLLMQLSEQIGLSFRTAQLSLIYLKLLVVKQKQCTQDELKICAFVCIWLASKVCFIRSSCSSKAIIFQKCTRRRLGLKNA
eukprot:TRINITY_DN58601_c0_g1_i1.p2 TRINITY_DN58601_c0_g1~~TRINITY_DN58601_c0_g1_i1.p2  ORF type:complete len:158 (-),score=13.87 TRINITY_DN58601_c0_g1_i1:417-890(-)